MPARPDASGASEADALSNAPADRQIRVLIVEDHRMFSEALRAALDTSDDIAVTAAMDTATSGVEEAKRSRPDVVLMDYRLPDGDGVDAARRIKQVLPDTKIVMLSGTLDDTVLREAIQAGCSGYLTKGHAIEELILAVRAAHRGEALISPQMLSRLLDRASDRTRPGADLTSRETEVLRLLADGLSNQAIAERLGIRLATVRNHVQSVIEKLEAHSKLEAVATALRLGLIQSPNMHRF
ncbi:MAG: response regulator transcription factor [Candidatus Dormibacteraeota bacterium]|nr:response regulator transcription factor [Candidatus Dormibacteraeota bacterium]